MPVAMQVRKGGSDAALFVSDGQRAPPSMRRICPVTNGASRSNHSTAAATSCGEPARRSGVRASMVCWSS